MGYLAAGCFIAFVVFLVLFGYLLNEDGKKWEKFKQEHNCQKVAVIKGRIQTGYVYGRGGGPVITSEPDKTGWLCDDGVTYYR